MKKYVEAVIVPFITRQKANLKLPDGQGLLLVFNNFKAQITSSILNSHYVSAVLILANCTDCLRPMDQSVNKIFYTRSLKIGMLMKLVQI